MPGLNIIASATRIDATLLDRFDRVQAAMLHRPPYVAERVFETGNVKAGFTAFPAYPRHAISDPTFTAIVEGMIYNRSREDVEREIGAIARALRANSNDCVARVRAFVDGSDGEFVVAVVDSESSRLIVFNDDLARLPVYYHAHAGLLVLSREVKFLIPFSSTLELDRTGLLEYLLFGFTFDQRTLVSGASYLRPRSVLVFDPRDGSTTVQDGPSRDFTATSWRSRRDAVQSLREAFLEIMRRRVARLDGRRPVVSLSGGLDSRGTLAGLVAVGADPIAITTEGPEQGYASRVANALGVQIHVLPAPTASGDFERVAFLKDGLDCHPGLEKLYRHPETMLDLLGDRIVYFTGIYGGEITRYRNPTSSLDSTDSLADYLLSAPDAYKYSTSAVCALLGMTAGDVREHVRAFVAELPEKDSLRKYIHFRHQFDVKYAGEAEDRNRFYFWTISPYFGSSFFERAMSLDENHKDTPLFRDFLHALDPRTCEVAYYNYRMPMKHRLPLYGLSLAERAVRVPFIKAGTRRAFRVMRGARELFTPTPTVTGTSAEADGLMRSDLLNSPLVAAYFDPASARRVVSAELDPQGLERIRIVWTYVAAAEAWHRRLTGPR